MTIDWTFLDQGKGRPLLLLHGFTGAAESWDWFITFFAARFRVVAPDLPGHGSTPPTEDLKAMTIEATAEALATLLRSRDASPAAVLGYSLGARVALRLAVACPEAIDRLILESPSAGIADEGDRAERRKADNDLADRIERDGIAAFVNAWERHPVFASHVAMDPALVGEQRAIRLASDPHGLASSLRAAGQGAMEPLHDRLGEVKSPTLVIGGTLDTIGGPRAELVARGIPDARLALIDGTGHTPHLEDRPAFLRLVFDFLQEGPTA